MEAECAGRTAALFHSRFWTLNTCVFCCLCCRLNELAQALIIFILSHSICGHAPDCVSVIFPEMIYPFFFLFTDEKEDTVLGSLPLLSFQIGGVEPLDNITRKFAFKVSDIRVRSRGCWQVYV